VVHSILSFWSLLYVLSGQSLDRLVVTVVAAADDDDDANEFAVWSPHCSCWMLRHSDSEPLQ